MLPGSPPDIVELISAYVQPAARAKALAAIHDERDRQETLWGQQNLRDGTGSVQDQDAAKLQRGKTSRLARTGALTYRDVLEEEVKEAFAERDSGALQEELIQVAAVCVAWIECIKRRQS